MQLPPPLPLVVTPAPDENLHGYVRRLCALNGIPNLALFRTALGIGKLSPTTADEAPWLRLAASSLQPLASLKAMGWRRQKSGLLLGLVDFHGHSVQKKFLRTSRPRICPHCIRKTEIIRDSWSLFYMTACSLHSVQLVDSCDSCCNSLGEPTPLKYSSATRPWSCSCGRNLGDINTGPASPDALLVSHALEHAMQGEPSEKLSHSSICPEIVDLPPNDLMVFVDIVGTAATTPANDDIPDNNSGVSYRHGLVDPATSLEKCTRRVEAAGRIMANWPDGYQQLLRDIAHRNPCAPHHQIDRKAFATKIGAMMLFPRRSVTGVPLKILQDQIDEFCASKLDITRRKRNLATQDARALLVHRTANMSALAKDLGLNARSSLFQKIYRKVIEDMTLEGGCLDAEALTLSLQGAVTAYLQKSEDSISGTTAAAILEGARRDRRLQGWDHPDLLQELAESAKLFGKRKVSYSLSKTLALRDRFIALAKPADPRLSLYRLPEAMRMLLSGTYQKTDLLVDLLKGKFPLYKEEAPEHVFDLLLDMEQLRWFMLRHDLQSVFQNEKFLRLGALNRLVTRADSNLPVLTSADMKILRSQNRVRFQEEKTFDGRRLHPSYKYNAGDVFGHVFPAPLLSAAIYSASEHDAACSPLSSASDRD